MNCISYLPLVIGLLFRMSCLSCSYLAFHYPASYQYIWTLSRIQLNWCSCSFQLMKYNPTSMTETLKAHCTCQRHMKNILCQACGNVFFGRIRTMCLLHPNVIHLMDLECCPNCQANEMKEFSDCTNENRNFWKPMEKEYLKVMWTRLS